MNRLVLEPFFLHQEQVRELLGPEITRNTLANIDPRYGLPAAQAFALAGALAEQSMANPISSIQQSHYKDKLQIGQVIEIQQAFYFRRPKKFVTSEEMTVYFHAKLNTDSAFSVRGHMSSSRFTTSSAYGNLSGRKPAYVMGSIIDLTSNDVEIRPFFVGNRMLTQFGARSPVQVDEQRRVYPSQIDQFSKANFRVAPSRKTLSAVSALPEEHVKNALEYILGEPFGRKDWGGERSDLYTSHTLIDGNPASSAWLLKGPGHKGPMTIRALGSPGDQIDRLFSEPAELFVVQHHREIKAAVVNMMAVYAFDARRPKKYMILDGADTGRILEAYGLLHSLPPAEPNS